MAQAIDEPALGDDLHPGADTGGAGADPHQAEIAILKCFENSAQRRRWHGFRAVLLSDVYLRTSAPVLCFRTRREERNEASLVSFLRSWRLSRISRPAGDRHDLFGWAEPGLMSLARDLVHFQLSPGPSAGDRRRAAGAVQNPFFPESMGNGHKVGSVAVGTESNASTGSGTWDIPRNGEREKPYQGIDVVAADSVEATIRFQRFMRRCFSTIANRATTSWTFADVDPDGLDVCGPLSGVKSGDLISVRKRLCRDTESTMMGWRSLEKP